MHTSLLTLFLAVVAHLGLALAFVPTKPSDDPFYVAPANISAYKNGDIISWRPTPQEIRTIYVPVNIKDSYQFLVRSTDSFGNPNAVVTTLLVPYSPDPTKLWSYQIAEDAATLNCAPSYAIQFATQLNIEQQAEMIILETGLAKGWYVVVPDYNGPKSTFGAGWQSGHAVLDSVKAVLKSKDVTGLNSDAKVQLFGYSGGSLASGWAAQIQPDYAPELNSQLIGAALGGLTANITQVAVRCDGEIYAGLVALALRGLLNEYSALSYLVDKLVNPINKIKFYSTTGNLCLVPNVLAYPFTTFFKGWFPFFSDGPKFLQRADVKAVLTNNTMALKKEDGIPQCPIFVYHGTADEIVPFAGAERVYNNWCSWGIESYEFAVATTTGHALEAIEGCGAAIAWTADRFAGKTPVSGCSRTERVTNLEYPGADLSVYQLLITLISSVLGAKIGEGLNRSVNSVPAGFKSLEDFLIAALATLGAIPIKK